MELQVGNTPISFYHSVRSLIWTASTLLSHNFLIGYVESPCSNFFSTAPLPIDPKPNSIPIIFTIITPQPSFNSHHQYPCHSYKASRSASYFHDYTITSRSIQGGGTWWSFSIRYAEFQLVYSFPLTLYLFIYLIN